MKTFFLALTFLSIIPVPSLLWEGEEKIERALLWFPIIGAIIGTLSYTIFYLISLFVPVRASFIFSFFFYHLLNGGLHLDGLADFSDAFFGAKKNESRFKEILKDSHIGAMGVLAMIFYFLSIFAVTEKISFSLPLFIAIGMSGRTGIVIFATKSKSLFNEGLGRLFIEKSGKTELFFGLLIYLITMLLLGQKFLITAMIVLFFSFVFKVFIIKRFGGFSGDIFGAGCSLIEVLTIFLLAGLK